MKNMPSPEISEKIANEIIKRLGKRCADLSSEWEKFSGANKLVNYVFLTTVLCDLFWNEDIILKRKESDEYGKSKSYFSD